MIAGADGTTIDGMSNDKAKHKSFQYWECFCGKKGQFLTNIHKNDIVTTKVVTIKSIMQICKAFI